MLRILATYNCNRCAHEHNFGYITIKHCFIYDLFNIYISNLIVMMPLSHKNGRFHGTKF